MHPINETETLGAYHEAGRVFYAYKCGYTCGSIQLSATDPGAGVSSLSGGADTPFIQALLGGGRNNGVLLQNAVKAQEVAHKLMMVYCAGSCAKILYTKNGNTDEIEEINLPAQDIKYIEFIQDYLKSAVPGHHDEYPTETILGIFGELVEAATWKPIKTLADAILQTGEGKLDRFGIEDALLKGGLALQPRPRNVSMQVAEDETPAQPKQPEGGATGGLDEHKLLDIALKDFLREIKTDWDDRDLDGAIDYLKQIFKGYYE